MTQQTAVAVYSKPACQQCWATKRRMDKNGTEYTAVDVTEDQDAYDFVVGLGHQRLPVVVTSAGQDWSGYRPELIDTLKENK
ncbi:glutaredoxin domain-containing protein [Brachybacterium sp. NPDC056505]|uniref:glutaredoxin domain-containing protein n=1 Tax=Brachybacterium sp. NPDC056505 TaxID=3345843 RepID=UPI0036732457